MKLLIIADDLTGALDTAVQFRKCGASVKVITAEKLHSASFLGSDIDVLAVDAETRHVCAKQAYDLTFSLVSRAIAEGVCNIYIKTDSGLRGNIGSELQAALAASGQDFIPFIPAFPDMYRITKGGMHFIDGLPIDKGVFGNDLFEPVISPYVKDLFSNLDVETVDIPISDTYNTNFNRPVIGIFDAQTNQDMQKIANHLKSYGQLRIMSGCSGFASIIKGMLDFTQKQLEIPALGNPLIVFCGSLSPIARQQIEYGEKIGYDRFVLSPQPQMQNGYFQSDEGEKWLESMSDIFFSNNTVLIDTGVSQPEIMQTIMKSSNIEKEAARNQVSKALGKMIWKILENGYAKNRVIMVIGGDTMLGFLRQIPWQEINPICEIELGTVLSLIKVNGENIWVISKSGGFGEYNSIEKIAKKISGSR